MRDRRRTSLDLPHDSCLVALPTPTFTKTQGIIIVSSSSAKLMPLRWHWKKIQRLCAKLKPSLMGATGRVRDWCLVWVSDDVTPVSILVSQWGQIVSGGGFNLLQFQMNRLNWTEVDTVSSCGAKFVPHSYHHRRLFLIAVVAYVSMTIKTLIIETGKVN